MCAGLFSVKRFSPNEKKSQGPDAGQVGGWWKAGGVHGVGVLMDDGNGTKGTNETQGTDGSGNARGCEW